MRQLILLTLFGLTTLTLFAQSTINQLQHSKFKKGIYFTFNQIAVDNPSRTDSFMVKERTETSIVMWGGGKYTFELESKDKSEFKKIRKELIGISDGESFFISDKFTVGGWQGLTRCLLSGPYIIAQIQGSAGQYSGGGVIPSMIKIGNGFLINLNNGASTQLTKKALKELLSKYPDLSKEYANKSDLIESAVEIVDKINKIKKDKSLSVQN